MDSLAGYRSEFTESERFIDFAAVGPMSRRANQRLQEHAAMLSLPDRRAAVPLLEVWADARELGARLLGTDAEHVTYLSNTSHGLFAAAFGLAVGNVVIPANEFPANMYPWIRAEQSGRIEVRRVQIPDGRVTVERLREHIDAETVAVAVSAVGYTTGFRADLAGLREVVGDALLVVDAVQALGALRVDMSVADLVVAGSQKWMRAGLGSAIVGVSDRFLDRYTPTLSGWLGVEDPFGSAPAPHPLESGAVGLAMGSSPLMAVGTMRGSIEVTLEGGVDAIESAVLDRAEAFEKALVAAGADLLLPGLGRDERSGILSFRMPDIAPADVAEALSARGFVLTHREGSDWLRAAPHATTPLETADALRKALEEIAVRR